MGKISSLFIRKVLGIVEDGVDKNTLLHSVGIDPESPVDPSIMITDTDYYTLLERIASMEENPTTLPLRVGATMRCNDYGAFGLAWKSALNLRGSFDRAERYARVLTSVSTYEVELVDDGALMHLHRKGDRRLGMRLSNEATIASINTISREVCGSGFKPNAVFFKHQPPGSIASHQEYFGCPVHFDSDKDALFIGSELLESPNIIGGAGTSKFFETHLEDEVSKFGEDALLGIQIKNQISICLSEGVPVISDVASSLGMSRRTLQRRLSDLGETYQTLVDESRRQLAERLLRKSMFSLPEVAFMTGFSEQSAFTRAFKRWSGQTPRSFRITT